MGVLVCLKVEKRIDSHTLLTTTGVLLKIPYEIADLSGYWILGYYSTPERFIIVRNFKEEKTEDVENQS